MTPSARPWPLPVLLAGAALGAAVLVLGGAGLQAYQALSTPPAPAFALEPADSVRAAPAAVADSREEPTGLHPELLETAARQAVFHPERVARATRYQLPEDRIPEVVEAPSEPPPPPPAAPPFRLLGAVGTVGDDAGWVILGVEGESPVVLAVGDEFHGYRVAQVVGTSALLTGQGRSLRVTVQDPSPGGVVSVEASETRGREQRTRAQAQAEARNERREQQRTQEAVRSLARQLQQRFGGQVRIDGDVVILTRPDGSVIRFPAPGGGSMNETPMTVIRRPPGGGDR